MFTAILLLSAPAAHAVGLGSTAALGTGGWLSGGNPFDLGLGLGFAPTLDLYASPVIVQIHVLEFTEALIDDDDVLLGANVLFDAHDAALGGQWLGVVQPGGGLDLYAAGDTSVAITAQCRLGAQVQDAAGFGVYVVPEVGLGLSDGATDWIAGGTLQVSAWFGG